MHPPNGQAARGRRAAVRPSHTEVDKWPPGLHDVHRCQEWSAIVETSPRRLTRSPGSREMPETVVHFQVRMPPALHEHLTSRAKAEKTSLNALVVGLLQAAADRRKAPPG